MAKSNLFRHLNTPGVQERYLGDNRGSYLFLSADAHTLAELSERAVYDLLTERLLAACEQHRLSDRIIERVSKMSDQIMETPTSLAWQRSFRGAVRAVLDSDANCHLVVLIDQFDEVYRNLPPQFFVNLRGVRDEYKYRVSYVLLTRDELPRLNSAPECEEFYELFSANVFGLAPYSQADALELLARVSSRYDTHLPMEICEKLIELTAGHPGLLKASCLALIRNNELLSGKSDEEAISDLLKIDDVRTECGKLWDGLGQDERLALKNLTADRVEIHNDEDVIRRLRLKCLVKENGAALRPFSDIFANYAAEQKAVSTFPTKIQAGYIRIDTAGEVWIEDRLVTPQLARKELLFLEYLCLEPGTLRTKDEIIAVVYPEEYQAGNTPSDDAFNALVKRLRDRLEQSAKRGSCIVTVRGKGYRLEPK